MSLSGMGRDGMGWDGTGWDEIGCFVVRGRYFEKILPRERDADVTGVTLRGCKLSNFSAALSVQNLCQCFYASSVREKQSAVITIVS